ncbi:hypothetical protein TREPR_2298 [Treponema primitia ZAS-2]|uniref:Lipoprotein n=1 Tax=Treponema primitia (strain ATCC BAA-887 / DSM 12427 / ZAS-2) TaxID=545694 RepID=F5YI07_TREPZ|nr:hypothetical protein [Treponema primitia]AEF85742.1 hypothetical protein TREPR_2298 [Treponema primitia ZAS-2]
MKRYLLLLCALTAALLSPPRAHAQTAGELERLLGAPIVSYQDAAWLVLSSVEAVPGGTAPADAYQFALDRNWLPKKATANSAVTLGGVSLLIMEAAGIKGGIMFTLTHGSRYAYRDLVYRGLIQGRAYATQKVSGERLLQILGRALEYTETGVRRGPSV